MNEHSLTAILCKKWQDSCDFADKYNHEHNVELANLVKNDMYGWLSGFSDAVFAFGNSELSEDVLFLKFMWFARADIVFTRQVERALQKEDAA